METLSRNSQGKHQERNIKTRVMSDCLKSTLHLSHAFKLPFVSYHNYPCQHVEGSDRWAQKPYKLWLEERPHDKISPMSKSLKDSRESQDSTSEEARIWRRKVQLSPSQACFAWKERQKILALLPVSIERPSFLHSKLTTPPPKQTNKQTNITCGKAEPGAVVLPQLFLS